MTEPSPFSLESETSEDVLATDGMVASRGTTVLLPERPKPAKVPTAAEFYKKRHPNGPQERPTLTEATPTPAAAASSEAVVPLADVEAMVQAAVAESVAAALAAKEAAEAPQDEAPQDEVKTEAKAKPARSAKR